MAKADFNKACYIYSGITHSPSMSIFVCTQSQCVQVVCTQFIRHTANPSIHFFTNCVRTICVLCAFGDPFRFQSGGIDSIYD